jgi:two-component system sensor histidine kinase KdpD
VPSRRRRCPPIAFSSRRVDVRDCRNRSGAGEVRRWLTGYAARVVDDSFELAVSDNGPGLPQGREAEMFHMFERGQRESATPGVGLGLALSHAIVEAHGGTITAGNALEGGARFVMRIPQGQPPVLLTGDALPQRGES